MPFGLKNSPIQFQRSAVAKLKEIMHPGDMLHYMEDILVGAQSETEFLNKLVRVFGSLKELNLTLNAISFRGRYHF